MSRRRRGLILKSVFLLFAATVVGAHIAHPWDDRSMFDHQTFRVTSVLSGDVLQIALKKGGVQTVKLAGIIAPEDYPQSRNFLANLAMGQAVTLLLQSPQARDTGGRLLACAFVNGTDLGVELAKAGMVYADRRQASILSGLIAPAEAEARQKCHGIWEARHVKNP